MGCTSLVSLEGLADSVKRLYCSDCLFTSLKGISKNIEEICCHACKRLTSLEGLPKGIRKINCTSCGNLKYIPDYIPNDIIKGLSKAEIALCRANEWIKNKKANLKVKLADITNSITRTR